MASFQFLWEMARALVQLAVALWPVTVILVAVLLFRGGLYIYKTRRYAQAGMAEVDRLSGQEFEHYLAVLFKRLGYQVQRTPYQGDYGADLVLRQGSEKTVVQAKRYHRRVGVKAVQEAVAAKEYYHCDKAMVVTNNSFSQQAQTLAKANQVELWDRETLVSRLRSVKKPESAEADASMDVVADSQADQQLAATIQVAPTCAKCGKPVSVKVQEYCAAHTDVFQGLTYCYEHQKEMRNLQATR